MGLRATFDERLAQSSFRPICNPTLCGSDYSNDEYSGGSPGIDICCELSPVRRLLQSLCITQVSRNVPRVPLIGSLNDPSPAAQSTRSLQSAALYHLAHSADQNPLTVNAVCRQCRPLTGLRIGHRVGSRLEKGSQSANFNSHSQFFLEAACSERRQIVDRRPNSR